jgi:hypothetical protein
MKINRLGTFTLGVIITAVSVGTVSFVNAASDATIKACANKKTGAMRYISKGSCKSSERVLTWNLMGTPGTPGAAGARGATGLTGPIGPAGPAGLAGAAGTAANVETINWSFPYLTTSWGNCPLAFLGDGPTPVGYLIINPSSSLSSNNATPIYSCTARIKANK